MLLSLFKNLKEKELLKLGLNFQQKSLKKIDIDFKIKLTFLLEEDKIISFLKSNEVKQYLKENNISEIKYKEFLAKIKNVQDHNKKQWFIIFFFEEIEQNKEKFIKKENAKIINSKI